MRPLRILAALAALTLVACAYDYRAVELAPTPATFEALSRERLVWVTDTQGITTTFDSPKRFGDALCGRDGCIRAHEIAAVRVQRRDLDAGDTVQTAGAAVVVAPVLALFTLPLMCANGCTPSGGKDDGRRWVTADAVASGCFAEAVPESDAKAAQRIWAERHDRHARCLGFSTVLFANDPEKLLEIATLAQVRTGWEIARCAQEPTPQTIATYALAPEAMRLRDGASVLARIEAVIADPRTYAARDDEAAQRCAGWGLAPETDWPRRREIVARSGPFVRRCSPWSPQAACPAP